MGVRKYDNFVDPEERTIPPSLVKSHQVI